MSEFRELVADVITSPDKYPLCLVFECKALVRNCLNVDEHWSIKESVEKQRIENIWKLMQLTDYKTLKQVIELRSCNMLDEIPDEYFFLYSLDYSYLLEVLTWMLVKQQKGN